jgi:hypothetical protein
VHILFVEISLCNSGILQVCQNKEKKKDDENYLASSFQPVANRQIFAGNLVNAQTVRREKYPREFFPEVIKKKSSLNIFKLNYFAGEMVTKRFYTNSMVNQRLVCYLILEIISNRLFLVYSTCLMYIYSMTHQTF